MERETRAVSQGTKEMHGERDESSKPRDERDLQYKHSSGLQNTVQCTVATHVRRTFLSQISTKTPGASYTWVETTIVSM